MANIKDIFDGLYDTYVSQGLAISVSFIIGPTGDRVLSRFSIHKPYEWDGKKESAFITFDVDMKEVSISNLTLKDLKDKGIQSLLGITGE